MSRQRPRFAIIGAESVVGREILTVLAERQHNIEDVALFTHRDSETEVIEVGEIELDLGELGQDSFEGIDIAFFADDQYASARLIEHALSTSATVIDCTQQSRVDNNIPLVVPEVNAGLLRQYLRDSSSQKGLLIASPSSAATELVVVLKPLHDRARLKRVVVSTYQAVSDAGKQGMDELWNQTLAIFNQNELETVAFPHQIAFHCFPQIDAFVADGYTQEEQTIVNETRRVLGLPKLGITATAVRVPVFNCHAQSVNVELESGLLADEAREVLRSSPGILVIDSPEEGLYPLALDVAGSDATYVGRIRDDFSVENGLNLWVVADNIRKGAALNAVEIAEIVVAERYC